MRFSSDISQLALPDIVRDWDIKDDLFDRLTLQEGYALYYTALKMFEAQVEINHPDKMVFVEPVVEAIANFIEGAASQEAIAAAVKELDENIDWEVASSIEAFVIDEAASGELTVVTTTRLRNAFLLYPEDMQMYERWWDRCLKSWGATTYDEDLYREKVAGLMRRYLEGAPLQYILGKFNNDDIFRLYYHFCEVYIESDLVKTADKPKARQTLEFAVGLALFDEPGPNLDLWENKYREINGVSGGDLGPLEPVTIHYASSFYAVLIIRMRDYLMSTFTREPIGKVAGFDIVGEGEKWLIRTATEIVAIDDREASPAQIDPFQVPILTVDDIVDDLRAKEHMGTQYGGAPSAHTVCVSFFEPSKATDEGYMVRDTAEAYPVEGLMPVSVGGRNVLVLNIGMSPLYTGPLVFMSSSFSEGVSPENPFKSAQECLAYKSSGAITLTTYTTPDSLGLAQAVKTFERLPRETELFVEKDNRLAPLIGVCYYVDDSRVIFRAWGEPNHTSSLLEPPPPIITDIPDLPEDPNWPTPRDMQSV